MAESFEQRIGRELHKAAAAIQPTKSLAEIRKAIEDAITNIKEIAAEAGKESE